MYRKTNTLLGIITFIIMFSLMLALTPTSDCDNDGCFDSLITEGLLFLPLVSSLIERPARQDQIPAFGTLIPKAVTSSFRHPPIFA